MFLSKPMLGTQIDWSNPLNDGLVLDLLMNEGHGDRVNDLIGYGNHGTLHNFDFPPSRTSGWNPGLDGVGLTFNGDDDYIDVTGFSCRETTYTIDMLVCSYDSSNSGKYLFDSETDRILIGWGSDTAGQIGVYDGTWRLFGDSPSANVLHRVTFVLDGSMSKMKMFLDGSQYGSELGYTPRAIGGTVHIGARYAASADDWYAFNGSIARVRILPRVMSAFEVMQMQINPYGVYLQ